MLAQNWLPIECPCSTTGCCLAPTFSPLSYFLQGLFNRTRRFDYKKEASDPRIRALIVFARLIPQGPLRDTPRRKKISLLLSARHRVKRSL